VHLSAIDELLPSLLSPEAPPAPTVIVYDPVVSLDKADPRKGLGP
jgi:hypothetical protein